MKHSTLILSLTNFALMVGLLTILTRPIVAQQSVPEAPLDRSNPEKARMQDMSRREMQLRSIGNVAEVGKDRRQLQALMAEIEQDFNRILILHNEIARTTARDKALDYKFVSDAAGEIKTRARRLKSHLLFYEAVEGEEEVSQGNDSFNEAHVKDALISLCKRIRSFVTNPVIENPGTVNIKESARAGQDLDRVIELSTNIHKTAERLKKR